MDGGKVTKDKLRANQESRATLNPWVTLVIFSHFSFV